MHLGDLPIDRNVAGTRSHTLEIAEKDEKNFHARPNLIHQVPGEMGGGGETGWYENEASNQKGNGAQCGDNDGQDGVLETVHEFEANVMIPIAEWRISFSMMVMVSMVISMIVLIMMMMVISMMVMMIDGDVVGG